MLRVPVHIQLALLTVCGALSGGGTALEAAADPFSLCDKFGAYDAVFVGTPQAPVKRRVIVAPDLKPEPLVLYPVSVERAFRGPAGPLVYLYIPEPNRVVAVGRRYLIYANRFAAPTDVFILLIMELEEEAAATDLEFLDSVAHSPATGTIHGTMTEGDIKDSNRPRTPLGGVAIRFSSDAYTTDTVTRHDGSFVVSGLPEGLAWVEPFLPDHLTAPRRGVYVKAGGCVSYHIVAAMNGRVSGRVLRHDGTPYSWMVHLMPLEPIRHPRHTEVRANADGEFEFSGQFPGEYLLGVNLDGAQYDPNPTTFYPGTAERAAAVPIVLGAGTERTGFEFRLPPEVPGGEIVVQVDTRGAADEVVVCMSGTSGGRGSGGGLYQQFVPNAPIVIPVLEGRPYRLAAHVERRTGHSESSEVEISGTANRQYLTLVADGPGASHSPNGICVPHWYRQRGQAHAGEVGIRAPLDVNGPPRR